MLSFKQGHLTYEMQDNWTMLNWC